MTRTIETRGDIPEELINSIMQQLINDRVSMTELLRIDNIDSRPFGSDEEQARVVAAKRLLRKFGINPRS